AIAARITGVPFDPNAAESLVVVIRGRNGVYDGIAELRDAAGATEWSLAIGPIPRDCAVVVDSLALSVAIKLRPRKARPSAEGSASTRLFGVDGEVVPVPQMAPTAPPVSDPRPQPAPAGSVRRVLLGAGASVDVGSAPGIAFGLSLDMGLRWPSFSLS